MPFADARLVARIAAIHQSAFSGSGQRNWSAEEVNSLLALPTSVLITAPNNLMPFEDIDGFALFCLVEDEAELLMLAVDTPRWGHKIGHSLLTMSDKILQQKGVKRALLEVASPNKRAIMLYTLCGFKVIGRRPAYYLIRDKEYDALIMEKKFC